jgi:nitroreductase
VDTLLAIASRRDERRTLQQPVPGEVVLRLLDAGRLSGSSRNSQPWTFVVPTSRSRIEQLAAAVYVPDNVLQAGLTVAILARGSGGRVFFDSGRAAQSMLLAAWAEGLASCPNGVADLERAREALAAAEDETPVIVLTFGLPDRPRDPEGHTAAEWSARANRKPLDEVVRWLS